MNRLRHMLPLLLFLPIIAFGQAPAPANDRTALDKYVEAPDPSYKYELVNKVAGARHTTYILKMTSQTWRASSEVDRNVWWHWMILV
ncbi:MAG: PhoPQ-activated protein PqaA family protein, partial [Blastocatellia bacterium]|nr:PhoPQ-activated protein PqaA family protein [Blastocatellia bacterium]